MNKEKIEPENLLIGVDDISLPLGTLRLQGQGGAGGHNGIGNEFPRGAQCDFVLSSFGPDDNAIIESQFPTAIEMIKSFCLSGLNFTMNHYNKRKPTLPSADTPSEEKPDAEK